MKKLSQSTRPLTTGLLALAIIATLPLNAETVLLNDTFANGSKTNSRQAADGEKLPSSGWFLSNTKGYEPSAKELKLTSSVLAVAYFQTVTLAVGESITLRADFSISTSANSNNGIRFGLFDSMGTKTTANEENATTGERTDDKGFFVTLNPGEYKDAGALMFRSQRTGHEITSPFGENNQLVPNIHWLPNKPNENTRNSLEFTITLINENTLRLSLKIDGNPKSPLDGNTTTVEVPNSDPSFTKTFDEAALAFWDGVEGTFDNIKIVHHSR